MKGDLISRKAVIKALRADYKDCIADPGEGQLIAIGPESAVDIVRDIQAEDVAPVAHGHWVHASSLCDPFCEVWRCSCCSAEDGNGACYNYCPSCGAKMDKEANNGLDIH